MRGIAITLVASLCLATGCASLLARRDGRDDGDGIVPERTMLRVGVGSPIDTAPLRIAVADGTFTRAGLHVELVPEKSDADALSGLTNGSLDVAFATDVTVCHAAASGTALRFQAEAYTSTPFTMALLTPPGSHYTELTARKSPKIAVDDLNGLSVLAVRSMFTTAGGDPSDIRFVRYPFEQMQDALRDRSVDAALMIEWFITQTQQALGAQVLADSAQGAMMSFPMTGYASLGTFAENNPRTMALFRQVLTSAQRRASDPSVIRQALPELSGIDDATADQVALGEYPTSLSGTRLQRVADLMHSSGMLANRLDVGSLLPRATG
jgi:NitT/TauT family transport system substrate-binding protein